VKAAGGGIGRPLLAPMLELADRQSVDCYLETSVERTLPWYTGGPTYWTMLRPPAGQVSSSVASFRR
jgi:hypothetical protein